MGNNNIGSKLVAGKGNASVSHQVAIKIATPKVLQAIMFNESGMYRRFISININAKKSYFINLNHESSF